MALIPFPPHPGTPPAHPGSAPGEDATPEETAEYQAELAAYNTEVNAHIAAHETYYAAVNAVRRNVIPHPWRDALTEGQGAPLVTDGIATRKYIDERIGSLASAVAPRIAREAPNAPDDAKDEALVRVVGYLWSIERTGWGAMRSLTTETQDEQDGAGHSTAFKVEAADASAAFLRSGARALLKPWATRRAGAI